MDPQRESRRAATRAFMQSLNQLESFLVEEAEMGPTRSAPSGAALRSAANPFDNPDFEQELAEIAQLLQQQEHPR